MTEFQNGGWIPAYDGTTDRVPFVLHGPEYIIPKREVLRLGAQAALDQLNRNPLWHNDLDYLWDARD